MRCLRPCSFTACVLAVLTLSGPAVGQPRSAAEAITLEPLEVTIPRLEGSLAETPAGVSVVGRSQIQDGRQGLGLDESLARVPGAFFLNRHNFAQDLRISIRGFGARAPFGVRGVRILVDGIPQTLPDGQAQVDGFDIDTIERMEVIRGPASALYGNASGGAIRIDTMDGPDEPFLGGEFKVGSYGFTESNVRAGGRSGSVRYFVNASTMKLDGFRDNSRTVNHNVSGKVRYQLEGKGRITGIVRLFDSPTAEDPGGLTAAQVDADREQAAPGNLQFDGGEEVDQQQLGLVYERPVASNGELKLRGHYTRRDFANRLPFEPGGQVAFDRHAGGVGARYRHSGRVAGLDHRLTIGFDVERQRDDRRRFDNLDGQRGALTLEQIETVDNIGVFAQDRIDLTERWQITAGGRYDRVRFDVDDDFLADGDDSGSRTLDEPSFFAGSSYAFLPGQRVYINAATAFETPTTTELALPGGGGFNPALEPQTAINYELGLKGLWRQRLRYQLAAFRIEVDDEIIPREDSLQREFFENAGSSTRNGIELSLDYPLSPSWTARTAYTFSDFTFDRFVDADGNVFDGNRIPGIPRHNFFGEIAWRRGGTYVVADLRANSEIPANNANTADAAGHARINLRAGRRYETASATVEPFIAINNVLDKEYAGNVRINAFGGAFFEPAPERNIFAGVEVSL